MAERTDPIRQDIDATRASMSDTLEQIEGQVRGKVDATVSQARRAIDLKHQVNERPWLMLGAAVTAGYLLGSMGGDGDGPPQHRPGEPMRYYPAEGHGPAHERRFERGAGPAYQAGGALPDHGRGGQMMGAVAQLADPLREELALIASAAMRSAMRALRETLRESIPQFEREYRAAAERHQGQGEQGFAEQAQAREVGGSGLRSEPSYGGRSGDTTIPGSGVRSEESLRPH